MSKVKKMLLENTENLINSEPSETRIEAERLHTQIIINGQIAAEAILKLAECLKEMRDRKLYSEFGYGTFEEYCEEKAGIKQRQAYNFIYALENLGKDYLQSNAKLGITKLVELARLADVDREELERTVDVESVSTRELQKKVDELQKKCDQLTMECEAQCAESTEVDEELTGLKQEKEALEKEIEELKNKPVEVAVSEPSAEQLKKIRSDVKKELETDKKKIESVLKETEEKLEALKKEKELETARVSAVSKELEKAQSENKVLQANAKKAVPSGNKELVIYHSKEIERSFNAAAEILINLGSAEREKYVKGFMTVLDKLREKIEDIADN